MTPRVAVPLVVRVPVLLVPAVPRVVATPPVVGGCGLSSSGD
ncbi:hypothetical protein [Saccharothrix variisporea]|nr:hypothetical protein [Saccharothrix variisporea]